MTASEYMRVGKKREKEVDVVIPGASSPCACGHDSHGQGQSDAEHTATQARLAAPSQGQLRGGLCVVAAKTSP